MTNHPVQFTIYNLSFITGHPADAAALIISSIFESAGVPTNQISFAKVLPDDYADYLHTLHGIPCIRFDQEEKALLGHVGDIEYYFPQRTDCLTTAAPPPVSSPWQSFYEGLDDGDSGNPMFIIIDGQPVVLTAWSRGGHGYGMAVHKYKKDLNTVMSELSDWIGDTNNYQLTEIDLSGFTPLQLLQH